jgi:hypothetical protein
MITTIERQSGDTPSQLLADAGYCSEANLGGVADTTIDAFIATRKQKHGEATRAVPARACAEDGHTRGAHGSEASHQGRGGGLCGAERNGRAGDRPNQTRAGLPAILAAWIRQGAS